MRIFFSIVAILGLIGCSQNQSKKSTELEAIKTQSGMATSHDGVKINFQVMGEGEPILLIHGYYANMKNNWIDNGIAPALAKKYKVVLMDNRGHGKSDKPQTAEAYGDNMWKDAIAVLDHLKIEKAHIHGYSMGGSMLTQILYHHPERVLTATYGGAGVPEVSKKAVREQTPDKTPSKMSRFNETKLKAYIATNFSHDHKAMKLVAKNAPWSGPENKKIDLKKVTIPVLAIVGEFDSPNKRTSRMSRELKNFKMVVLPEKGHLTAITEGHIPPEYLAETLSFLENNSSL